MSTLVARIMAIAVCEDLSKEEKTAKVDEIMREVGFQIPRKFGNAAVALVNGGATIHAGIGRQGIPELLIIYRNHEGEMRVISTSYDDPEILNQLFSAIDTLRAAVKAQPGTAEYVGSLGEGHALLLQVVSEELDNAGEELHLN